MKIYTNPSKKDWEKLSKRPLLSSENITEKVEQILESVKKSGDKALRKYNQEDFEWSILENNIKTYEELMEIFPDATRKANPNFA